MDPLGFSNIYSDAKQQKIEGGPFGEKKFQKNLTMPKKTERGDPLVSPDMVCYAEKQEKPFWFTSLGQMVQFSAIIFCRTFRNYFGQFVWIEKSHYNSRVSLHEAPTKNTLISIFDPSSLEACNLVNHLVSDLNYGKFLFSFLFACLFR